MLESCQSDAIGSLCSIPALRPLLRLRVLPFVQPFYSTDNRHLQDRFPDGLAVSPGPDHALGLGELLSLLAVRMTYWHNLLAGAGDYEDQTIPHGGSCCMNPFSPPSGVVDIG